METTSNLSNPIIRGGMKNYQVCLNELSSFLDICHKTLDIKSAKDLEYMFETLTDITIDGVDDDLLVSRLKQPLKFIRELDFLFRGMLYEQKG